ncbi:MAG: DoxX family membrane protein [Blastocatellia bacterium]|jgi:uncharacterized membrane protein
MSRTKLIFLYLLALFFISAGINHFVAPDFYLRIMPPYLPYPALLHQLAGAAEIILGALVLVARWRRLAAWGLVLLLLAVFPANLHVAFNSHLYPDFPAAMSWGRLPLQLVFLAWAWWYTRPDRG